MLPLFSRILPKHQLLHTPPNPALTQSTSPLINEPPFVKSNFTCPMALSGNVEPTHTLCRHVFHDIQHQVPPSLLSRYKHQANKTTWFELQKVDVLNHVPTFSRQEHSMYQTTCPHSTNHLQHHPTKGQHDTLFGSITPPFK